MFRVLRPQPPIINILIQKRPLSWFPLAILLWSIEICFLSGMGWSQESISLPKKETLTPTRTRTTELSTPTFSPDNPPPPNYSPPKFDKNNAQQFNTYRLDVGDGISINVPLFPEFDTVATINEEGKILMPIVGRISLAGLSLAEAEQKIIYELSNRYLQTEPEVYVSLAAPRPAQVSILGEVVRPGFYSFVAGSPLNVALSATGGSTKDADLRSVIIRRSLVDGSVIERRIDLYTPLLNSQTLPDVRLQGGDTIIVNKLEVGSDRDYDRSLITKTTLPQQTITVRIVAPLDRGGRALRNISLPNGSTFLDAIAVLPGGDGILIKVEEVALMRFDREQGKVLTQTLNTKKALNGDLAQNVNLQDEDVIIVSRTFIGRVFNAFTVLTRPIRDFFSFRRFIDDIFE
ncbi:MAG: polysaccharide biosynthesis/export family protein [Xenococcaceae cyanobacterium MO_188.B32]|nr:polysaccharide biosynthesis/export family protein [Xenococcaceae cyanobacterium MO_188.B32]